MKRTKARQEESDRIVGWPVSPLIRIENWCDFVNDSFNLERDAEKLLYSTEEGKNTGIKMDLSPETLTSFVSRLLTTISFISLSL